MVLSMNHRLRQGGKDEKKYDEEAENPLPAEKSKRRKEWWRRDRPLCVGIGLLLFLVVLFGNAFQVPPTPAPKGPRKRSKEPNKEKGDAASRRKVHNLQMTSHFRTVDNSSSSDHVEECRYEGHCLEGKTCVVDSKSSTGGVCKPYIVPQEMSKEVDPNKNDCVRLCMEELVWEEGYMYESKPILELVGDSPGMGKRPDGCVLQYHREAIKDKNRLEMYTNAENWMSATLLHRVVRTDVMPGNTKTHSWTAFCYQPCTETDCGNGFTCHPQGKVCRPAPSYWTPTDEENHDMVFVSGANHAYFSALANLAASLMFWAPQHKLVVYNLGMEKEHLKTVKEWPNVHELRWEEGIPEDYPPHVKSLKKYAWKPIIINETLHEFGCIFWLDAGNSVVGNLTQAIRIVRQTGIFLVKGQDLDMKVKSFPSTYSFFGHDKTTFLAGPHFSGNTQAYLYPSRYIEPLVKANAACALSKECIAPEGSGLANHRYDQTTLSVLSYRDHLMVPHHTEYLAAGEDQLARSRKVSSFRFVWTSRGRCQDYIRIMGDKFPMYETSTNRRSSQYNKPKMRPATEHDRKRFFDKHRRLKLLHSGSSIHRQ